MNIALWPRDSIARRFALTVALAVAVDLVASSACSSSSAAYGRSPPWSAQACWSRPPIWCASSRLHRRPIRKQLAAAASTGATRADWYAATSPVSTVLEQATGEARRHIRTVMEKLLGDRRHGRRDLETAWIQLTR